MNRLLVAVVLGSVLSACASGVKKVQTQRTIEELIEQSKRPEFRKIPPGLRVEKVSDKAEVSRRLTTTLSILVDGRGLAKAADRTQYGEEDPTNYDAAWVRDNLWVYLGLQTDPREYQNGRTMLLTLADYFASPAQMARIKTLIADPKVLRRPDGAMQVPHIRFDRASPEFSDVQEGGKPQTWNHKQNDALGLFLDLFCRAVISGEIARADLTPIRSEMIELLPRYFRAVGFASMPDAGSWEEIERVNTSSVALVTSGLERLQLARRSFPRVNAAEVAALIDAGYATVRKQLAAGGESPGYAKDDPRYRTADAALLNLVFPARLARLGKKDFDRVFEAIAPLVGEVGIKRYLGDSYQSGNFWFETAKTDDTSSDASFAERGKKFIAGTEAEWFFDSWYSVAAELVGVRYGDARLRAESLRFLNRALAQITPVHPVRGADGQPVPPLSLPESYNVVVDPETGERAFAPSPITPLNWAKAALRLALDTVEEPVTKKPARRAKPKRGSSEN